MSSPANDRTVFKRHFTKENSHPYDDVNWKEFDAVIKDFSTGEVKFEQKGVIFPDFYSQNAVNIIASKYFRGVMGTENRESDYRQLISRIVDTNVSWGEEQGYFADEQEKVVYSKELAYILLHQMAYFNSPVWFNMGFPGRPQTASACFINSTGDSMEEILDLVKTEGIVFKAGSGSGVNVSSLRSKYENLSTGGTSSGALSFMKVLDVNAGAIKSGGATRRAAKMVVMNVDHPEILDFIQCKVKEEEKAFALIREGYPASFNGDAYSTVAFQNANHSVRVSDDFMDSFESDESFWTKQVSDGKKHKRYRAKTIMRGISEATWRAGDPGIQFDDLINLWNTCKSEKCNATNPCSEYTAQDDTSCNLASLNLMRFYNEESGEFGIEDFIHACKVVHTAQDIWIDKADYPIEKIGAKTKLYRTTGLGYANLGSLIMALGFPYDSDEGRSIASSITSLMTAACYANSAEHCQNEALNSFPEYEKNKDSMLEVIEMHREATRKIKKIPFTKDIVKSALSCWTSAVKIGGEFGYRNSYVTNIAPTGTIALAMDCDTTGLEPELALVKYKLMAGSDVSLQFVNGTVSLALRRLGYKPKQIDQITDFIKERGHVEGAPGLKEEDYPVFDCSFVTGERYIHHMGHIKMLAAIQPFISGASSKTINMPESATIDEIMDAYHQSWKMGIKCVAIYRDNSKGSQVLSTIKKERSRATRIKLPDDVETKRHRFVLGGQKVYIQTGVYEDGSPGEVFLTMSKQGTTIRGLTDTIGVLISLLLQYGVPLKAIVKKMLHTKFEPSGFSGNKKIPSASSVVDYLAKYLAENFMSDKDKESIGYVGLPGDSKKSEEEAKNLPVFEPSNMNANSGEVCTNCGSLMTTNGSCKVCSSCGATTGCS